MLLCALCLRPFLTYLENIADLQCSILLFLHGFKSHQFDGSSPTHRIEKDVQSVAVFILSLLAVICMLVCPPLTMERELGAGAALPALIGTWRSLARGVQGAEGRPQLSTH